VDVVLVLTVNAGSSSLRVHLVASDAWHVEDTMEVSRPPDSDDARAALAELLDRLPGNGPDAVAHRMVHGGPAVTAPTIVDGHVREALGEVSSLAPLHMPQSLALLDFLRERLPGVPHVACPDTAFHRGLPETARTYALPRSWRESWGLRRYGFHGISYGWALRRAAELLDRPAAQLNLVLTHLSGGSSVCAMGKGVSVDTSMGMTPLEGTVMSKRSGSVDPGLLLWLLRENKLTVAELDDGLQRQSGLLGLSGSSGDTRDLVAAAEKGDEHAALALEVFAHRVRREIAAAAASLPNLDAVVFTGDIGWDQPQVAEAVCAGLPTLGLQEGLSTVRDADAVISSAKATVPVLVVRPREELQLARLAREAVLGGAPRESAAHAGSSD
jgi:acetate kinase